MTVTNHTIRRCLASIALIAPSFVIGAAQAERLSADIRFIEVQSQSQPVRKVFRQPRSIRIKLRDDNVFQEWSARRADRPDQHSLSYESTIGAPTKVQYVLVTWRFESNTKLLRVTEFPSHIETIELIFRAGRCSATVTYVLKPGYREFSMWDLATNKLTLHDNIYAESAWCEVQEDVVS